MDYLLSERIVKASQFHGVDRSSRVVAANREAYPHANWHVGEFVDCIARHRDFNPSVVNADLTQTVETATWLGRLMDLVQPFQATLVLNLVMGYRNREPASPDSVVRHLGRIPQFRYALRNGWEYNNQCYLYAGRKATVMGTFIFRRV